MTSVLWPGEHRCGNLMSGPAVVAAMVAVEDAWLKVLSEAGVAPRYTPVVGLVTDDDVAGIGRAAESGGNAVIPLVAMLRERLRIEGHEQAAAWLHCGLTSQDVVDSALMICARDALRHIMVEVDAQVEVLSELAVTHRGTAMVARTLTQPAVPTTFGAKAATWLTGVLDAAELLSALTFPVQLGGAAGTLSALVELAGIDGAMACRVAFPAALQLSASAPWHTTRAPVTRLGDATVSASDAWGRIANDVLTLGRPEIGELAESTGGGSSTMPQKSNPTVSVLIRRAALAGPSLAATLHTAAAEQRDERADGAWHLEWDTLAVLLRRSAIAAMHTTTLLTGLKIDAAAMSTRAAAMADDVRAEQRSIAAHAGREPASTYLGLVDQLIDEAVTRAQRYKEKA